MRAFHTGRGHAMPSFSQGLILLSEHEYGFSATRLGFPSISACRAIMYQTNAGVFGFHQALGANPSRFDAFATKFANFVAGHPSGGSRGINLYVAAKIGDGSSYRPGMPGVQEHVAEMRAIADALQFGGPVLSYDLSYNREGRLGVFVECILRATHCEIWTNDWVEHHDKAHSGPPIGGPGDHVKSRPQDTGFTAPGSVLLMADSTGAKQVEPIPIPLR